MIKTTINPYKGGDAMGGAQYLDNQGTAMIKPRI
jgi:hypothetical protein